MPFRIIQSLIKNTIPVKLLSSPKTDEELSENSSTILGTDKVI